MTFHQTISAEQRFFRFVTPAAWDECWLWVGAPTRAGYATFWFNGKKVQAHRWSWEFLRSPIPEGLTVDHLCRVSLCMNPFHFDLVPNAINVKRARGTEQPRDECSNGHPYTSASVYEHRGTRFCRICNRQAARAYQKRRLARQVAA